MSAPATVLPVGAADERTTPPPVRRVSTRLAGLVVLTGILVAVCLASLAWGARDVAPGTVWDALVSPVVGNNDHAVVRDLRVPRTVVGLLAGVALGVAGALMQGLTRNPIADPGLLGVNAGAALAVVGAISLLGVGSAAGFVWFAFLGAALAALTVYGVASVGWGGVTPIKLVLVGAAFTAVATSAITLVLLTDERVLAAFRYWQVGSLVNRPWSTIAVVAPFVVGGLLLAVPTGRFLNAVALGDDLARGLGQNVVVGRLLVLGSVVLLCGSATSLAGPIAFVGLMVPHVARAVVGPDYRWVLPYAAVLGPIVLLVSDVVGRLIARPSEIEAGLVVAVIGAPVLIALVRGTKAVSS
ncbi:MAG: iron ABC transporter permease [Nocardioides sp.]